MISNLLTWVVQNVNYWVLQIKEYDEVFRVETNPTEDGQTPSL